METVSILFTSAALLGMASLITMASCAVMGRMNERERRKRHDTRAGVDYIMRKYAQGELSIPQVILKLREIEAPTDIVDRMTWADA